MADEIKPVLCTGTFFNLLIQAMKPKQSSQTSNDGRSDKISETTLLQLLINVFNPKIAYPGPNTGRKNCNDFKKCLISESTWIDFKHKPSLIEFNLAFEKNYSVLLTRMNDLFNNVIDINNEGKINLLGRSLLELIYNDDSINPDEPLYILEDKKGLLKKDIIPSLSYPIQPLALGIFHYALNRQLHEQAGRETFLSWYKKPGGRWIYYSKIGTYEFKNTKINLYNIPVQTNKSLQEEKCNTPSDKVIVNQFFKKYEKYYIKESKEIEFFKTILYKESPISFKGIYVVPDISNINSQASKENSITLNGDYLNTKNFIDSFGRYTSIIAPGGYGKSMFMKHLFLNVNYNNISNTNKTNLVPILVKIRSFTNSESITLEKLFHKKVKTYLNISFDEFIKDLTSGGFLLLIDGIDEINVSEVDSFFQQLDELTRKYPNNYYITSSRPSETMESLSKFKVLNLHGLDWEHSLQLIKKLPNYPEDIKNSFCNMLEDDYYKKYKKLAENPLLLTLMFKVSVGKKKLPAKTYQFYEKAFEVLYEEHEILKGHELRPFKTGLRKTNFLILLTEFCYFTSKNPRNEFSSTEIAKALRKTSFNNIDPDDFIEDLKDNLNLFYRENGKYHFIHKSFQECFCAMYLNEMDDTDFTKLPDWFEDFKNVKDPKTFYVGVRGQEIFTFLLQISKERTKKLIIYPYLEKLLSGPMQTEFLNFIYNVYENIEYGYESCILPKKHFANMLISTRGLDSYVDFYNLDLPENEKYKNRGYYMVPMYDLEGEWHGYEKWDEDDLISYLAKHPDETDESLEIKQGDYNVFDYIIPIINLKEVNEDTANIIALLESEQSPLYKIYKTVYSYKQK